MEKHEEKKCNVCGKDFGIMNRKKECKVCTKFMCKAHIIKNKSKTEICINCEINHIKNKRKKEIRIEINQIQTENQKMIQNLQIIDLEKQEKVKEINNIEQFILENERNEQDQESELNKILHCQKEKTEKARKTSHELTENLNKQNELEKEILFEIEIFEKRMQEVTLELVKVKDKNENTQGELTHFTKKLLSSLPRAEINKLLCFKCKKILNERNHIKDISEGNEDYEIANNV